MNRIKKTIYTLNINNYSKEITDITYPLIHEYAQKIGADFFIISERKFPTYPVTYEKLQIYELGRQMQNDWNIYIDSDALLHPDLMDITEMIPKDYVLHNGNDYAGNRWRSDNYFLRDGRGISSCNWFTVASDWCLDLWRPLDDMTLAEALGNIKPIYIEQKNGIKPEHLIDDYTLSRNIARYGLKFTTLLEIQSKIKQERFGYLWHQYLITEHEKIKQLTLMLAQWGLRSDEVVDTMIRILDNKNIITHEETINLKSSLTAIIQKRDTIT